MNNVRADIEKLILICENLEGHKRFNDDLNELEIKHHRALDQLIDTLKELLNYEHNHKNKVKSHFYKTNKEIIDNIYNRNKEFLSKIESVYKKGINGFFSNNQYYFRKKDYQPLYDYLIKNKEDISCIISVLKRLQKLGYEQIEFNESADFTKEVYDTKKEINIDPEILAFCENIEIIPNFGDYISYHTSKSSYRIIAKKDNPDLRIELNSLTFNPSSLPESVDYYYLYNRILEVKNKEENPNLRAGKAIDCAGKNLENIEKEVKALGFYINQLQMADVSEELKDAFVHINLEIARLKQIEEHFKSEIFSDDPSIPEVLKKEKNYSSFKAYYRAHDIIHD